MVRTHTITSTFIEDGGQQEAVTGLKETVTQKKTT